MCSTAVLLLVVSLTISKLFGRVFDRSLSWSSVRLFLKCLVVYSTIVWLSGVSSTVPKMFGRTFDRSFGCWSCGFIVNTLPLVRVSFIRYSVI